jgi:hypothetical protein
VSQREPPQPERGLHAGVPLLPAREALARLRPG